MFFADGGELAQWDWAGARRRCLREARRMVGTAAEAEDAVQEALLRAWRKRESCAAQGSPEPWLLRITRNEVVRLYGRSRRREEVELEETDHPESFSVEALTDRVDVARALARLALSDRLLVRMRYELDLSQREIAERLHLPEGTVKVRLHRLRRRLRTTLGSR